MPVFCAVTLAASRLVVVLPSPMVTVGAVTWRFFPAAIMAPLKSTALTALIFSTPRVALLNTRLSVPATEAAVKFVAALPLPILIFLPVRVSPASPLTVTSPIRVILPLVVFAAKLGTFSSALFTVKLPVLVADVAVKVVAVSLSPILTSLPERVSVFPSAFMAFLKFNLPAASMVFT